MLWSRHQNEVLCVHVCVPVCGDAVDARASPRDLLPQRGPPALREDALGVGAGTPPQTVSSAARRGAPRAGCPPVSAASFSSCSSQAEAQALLSSFPSGLDSRAPMSEERPRLDFRSKTPAAENLVQVCLWSESQGVDGRDWWTADRTLQMGMPAA